MTAPPQPLHLLLVEDDADAAEELAELLTLDGIEVVTAGTLAAARQALAARRFDAVLLDLELGSASGVDLAVELVRREGGGPFVVLLSGRALNASERAALGDAAPPLLAKPLRTETLVGLLKPLRASQSGG